MESLIAADSAVLHFINLTLTHPWLDAFFPLITDLHKTAFFKFVFPVFVLFFLLRRYRTKGFALFLGFALSLGTNDFIGGQLLKKHFDRARPFQAEATNIIQRCPAGGYSFPSNHASNTFTAATYLSFFLPGWAPALFTIATIVAYSRMYCGVHFPADVLAGAALGLIIGTLMARLTKAIVYRRERMPA